MSPRPHDLGLPATPAWARPGNAPLSSDPPPKPSTGDIPPALSPLDALALQGRMLARKLELGKRQDRRVSRLTPATIAQELRRSKPRYQSLRQPKLPRLEHLDDDARAEVDARRISRREELARKHRSIYPEMEEAGGEIWNEKQRSSDEALWDNIPRSEKVEHIGAITGQEAARISHDKDIDRLSFEAALEPNFGPGPVFEQATSSGETTGCGPLLSSAFPTAINHSMNVTSSGSIASHAESPPTQLENISSSQGEPTGQVLASNPWPVPFSPPTSLHPALGTPDFHPEPKFGQPRPSVNFSRPMGLSSRASSDKRPSFETSQQEKVRLAAEPEFVQRSDELPRPKSPPRMRSPIPEQSIYPSRLLQPGLDPRPTPPRRDSLPSTPKFPTPQILIVADNTPSASSSPGFPKRWIGRKKSEHSLPRVEPLKSPSKKANVGLGLVNLPSDQPLKENQQHQKGFKVLSAPSPKKQISRFHEIGFDLPLVAPPKPPFDLPLRRASAETLRPGPRLFRSHKSQTSLPINSSVLNPSPASPKSSPLFNSPASPLHNISARNKNNSPATSTNSPKPHRPLLTIPPDPNDLPIRTPHDHLTLGIHLHQTFSSNHDSNVLRESTYHLRLAARAGLPQAMLLYALACRNGWGIKVNQGECVLWLRTCAEVCGVELGGLEEGRGLVWPVRWPKERNPTSNSRALGRGREEEDRGDEQSFTPTLPNLELLQFDRSKPPLQPPPSYVAPVLTALAEAYENNCGLVPQTLSPQPPQPPQPVQPARKHDRKHSDVPVLNTEPVDADPFANTPPFPPPLPPKSPSRSRSRTRTPTSTTTAQAGERVQQQQQQQQQQGKEGKVRAQMKKKQRLEIAAKLRQAAAAVTDGREIC